MSREMQRPGSALGKVLIVSTAWSQIGKAMDWRGHNTRRRNWTPVKNWFELPDNGCLPVVAKMDLKFLQNISSKPLKSRTNPQWTLWSGGEIAVWESTPREKQSQGGASMVPGTYPVHRGSQS